MQKIRDVSEAINPGVYSINNFDLSAVHNACLKIQIPVLYISHENIEAEMLKNLAKVSNVGIYKIKKGIASPKDWDSLVEASEKMQEAELYLQGDTTSIEDIKFAIGEAAQRLNIQYVFLSRPANEDELNQLRKKFVNSLKGVLPSVKIIKLKKAEDDFNRKLLQQYRDKGPRR